jgi:hypothetical protein
MAMPDVTPAGQSQARPTALRRLLVLGLAMLALWPSWEIWRLFGGGNLHTVLPGRIYRGAQPSPRKLDALVQRLGIRTVVNLRGCCAPEPWYLDEARVSALHGINQEDITFSAARLPSKHELRHLIEVIDRSEQPLFFHCRQGADRTGLAAAVALLLQPDVSYADARAQLGWRYSHLSFGPTGRLDAVFDRYEIWLHDTQREHSPSAFRHWVDEEYRGGWCQCRIEQVQQLGAARAHQPLGFRLRVRNTGDTPWRVRPTITAGIHVGCRLSDDKGCDIYEGRGGLMETEIAPGHVLTALVVVPLPGPGRYRLLLDMVEEGHCWFYQAGADPWEEELVVHE